MLAKEVRAPKNVNCCEYCTTASCSVVRSENRANATKEAASLGAHVDTSIHDRGQCGRLVCTAQEAMNITLFHSLKEVHRQCHIRYESSCQ